MFMLLYRRLLMDYMEWEVATYIPKMRMHVRRWVCFLLQLLNYYALQLQN